MIDILDRRTCIHPARYFLEASAGTGKTHTIAHAVVRALIDSPPGQGTPLELAQILVVTFTRLAARELQERIYSLLKRAYTLLSEEQPAQEGEIEDYLFAHMEGGKEKILLAQWRLERALVYFESNHVETIHSFCASILREYDFSSPLSLEKKFPSRKWLFSLLKRAIDELFTPEEIPVSLFGELLSVHHYQFRKWGEVILSLALSKDEISAVSSLQESFFRWNHSWKEWKGTSSLTGEFFSLELEKLLPHYRGTTDRSGKLLFSLRESLLWWARVLDRREWSWREFQVLCEKKSIYLALFSLLSTERRKKKGSYFLEDCSLFYEAYQSFYRQLILPLSIQLESSQITLRLAKKTRSLIEEASERESRYSHDQLITQTERLLRQKSIAESVRSRFSLFIIDEFQDTDATQWKLFSTLFFTEGQKSSCLLVGDPKQSIYAFRHADIYTYFSVMKLLGEKHFATLSVNYRSHFQLTQALNSLFSHPHLSGLFALPQERTALPYRKVFSPSIEQRELFCEGEPRIHLFLTESSRGQKKKWPTEEIEEQFLFPAIYREILKLNQTQTIPLSEMAVLVRSHSQARRLVRFLMQRELEVEYIAKRALAELPILQDWILLLKVTLDPLAVSFRTLLFTGQLFDFSLDELVAISQDVRREQRWIQSFLELREIWRQKGVYPWFCHLMELSWEGESCLQENLLRRKGGSELFAQIHALLEWGIEQEQRGQLAPEQLLSLFSSLREKQVEGWEEHIFSSPLLGKGVQLLTLHASKGLEFSVVFALALSSRYQEKGEFFSDRKGTFSQIQRREETNDRYRLYCQEVDAEKMRLLYVAMTRAREFLYLFLCIEEEEREVPLGSAAPLELFWAQILSSDPSPSAQYQTLCHMKIEQILQFLQQPDYASQITVSQLYPTLHSQSKQSAKEREQEWECFCPFLPYKVDPLPQRFFQASSFTTEVEKRELLSSPDMGKFWPRDWYTPEQDVNTLPAGKQVGTLLHQMLESVPFKQTTLALLEQFVDRFLLVYSEEMRRWRSVFAQLLFYALRTPLPLGKRAIPLLSFPTACLLRELPFLQSKESHLFLQGCFDLLIYVERVGFFLLDWKSNWLGQSCEAYCRASLEREILLKGYDIQVKIYHEALLRFLPLLQRQFQTHLGVQGFLFLFLRGLGGKRGEGIYSISFSQ